MTRVKTGSPTQSARRILVRTTALVLATLAILITAPLSAQAATVVEERGSYVASAGISYFMDACGRNHVTPINNYESSCRWLRGADVGGLQLTARDEGALSPGTVRLRVCFYAEMSVMLDCPPTGVCPAGWTFCATVPQGTKYIGVASATGVGVNWHVVIQ